MEMNDYFQLSESTLAKTSYDTSKKEMMISEDIPAYHFDKIKEQYLKELKQGPKEMPLSNDALVKIGEHFAFVEFKNGTIDNKTNGEIKLKLCESLLLYLDIEHKTISDTRETMDYILVYNEMVKNDKKVSKQFSVKQYNQANEIAASNSLAYITHRLQTMAKSNHTLPHMNDVQFGMERFQNLYFRKVYTIPKCEADAFFKLLSQAPEKSDKIAG